MTPAAWLSVAALCALGAASPGPSLAVVVRHALGGSRARGVACALAHALGVGLYALVTAAGLATVLLARPGLYRALALAGACYLAWLGLGALRTQGGTPASAAGATPGGLAAAARDGFATALLNPKIAAFFLALFSQFVRPGTGATDAALLWATATVIDGAWYALVAVALTGSGALARLRARGVLIDRASGVLLLALAAWTAAQAVVVGA